jgi:Ca-activated chloride channel family protein
MNLLWPGFLLLLGLIPLIVGVYLLMLRRRRRFAVRYSSLSLVRDALPKHSWLRRHLPFIFFLAALACLILALTRPVQIVSIPTDQTTIILTLDVSGSMRSEDIKPNRLIAAENAALSFIQKQKSQTQIGLVAFSGFGELVQPPTTDQEALQSAVESLTVGRRTAIGSGILKALEAIAEVDPLVAPLSDDPSAAQPTPVPKGAYAPDIIVLLTDGVSNAGPLPLDAAQEAVSRGVRIYTIGFGTENGSIPFDQFQGGGGLFGGNGGGFGGGNGNVQPRGRFRTGIDEQTLKEIAGQTGGEYYYATSAMELQHVFDSLPTYLITKHEVTEISVFFAFGGAALAALAIFLSLVWHPLP